MAGLVAEREGNCWPRVVPPPPIPFRDPGSSVRGLLFPRRRESSANDSSQQHQEGHGTKGCVRFRIEARGGGSVDGNYKGWPLGQYRKQPSRMGFGAEDLLENRHATNGL